MSEAKRESLYIIAVSKVDGINILERHSPSDMTARMHNGWKSQPKIITYIELEPTPQLCLLCLFFVYVRWFCWFPPRPKKTQGTYHSQSTSVRPQACPCGLGDDRLVNFHGAYGP